MPKDAYYFKHDAYARHDHKCKSLINKHGWAGYGKYWAIVEMLRESSGYKMKDEPYIWEAMAEELRCPVQEVRSFVNDCIDIHKLFIREDGFFYSESLLLRMIKLDEIRQKRAMAGRMSWNDRDN